MLLSEENKVPEDCLKLKRRQGPPHVNKVKQYRLCCPLSSVCLFSHKTKDSLFKFV